MGVAGEGGGSAADVGLWVGLSDVLLAKDRFADDFHICEHLSFTDDDYSLRPSSHPLLPPQASGTRWRSLPSLLQSLSVTVTA